MRKYLSNVTVYIKAIVRVLHVFFIFIYLYEFIYQMKVIEIVL